MNGFPAQTAPTRDSAEKIELDLKRRRALGDLYEAPPITLGEAIDGTLARIDATRGVSEKTRAYNGLSAKFWAPLRDVRVPMLRRAKIEDMILGRRSIRAQRRTSSSSSSASCTWQRAAGSASTRRSSRFPL